MKEDLCARCGRFSPSAKTVQVRGVFLGPECFKKLQLREKIRGGGSNRRLVKDANGEVHATSDFGIHCPEEDEHCLECTEFRKGRCITEIHFGIHFCQG
jgi:hypothetical protein